MNRPSEPFNAEERDLAERLARLGGPREPAPALDARILAMARAAVTDDGAAMAPPAAATTTTTTSDRPVAGAAGDAPAAPAVVTPLRPRRQTPRWPLGLSLAASLVLAAGIGWKLHDHGAGIQEGTAAPAVAAVEESTQVIMVEPPMSREQPPPPPPPLESPRTASPPLADAMVAPVAAPQAPAAKPARVLEPAAPVQVYSAEVAADAAPAPAAAPPAPTSAPASQATEQDSFDRLDVTGSRIRRTDRDVGAAEYTRREQETRRRQATAERAAGATLPPPPPAPPPPVTAASRGGNQGYVSETAATRDVPKALNPNDFDDRPPVSADSPEFRQAWLQRIRELLAKGEQAWARESLREFRRRYPDAELPEDLRPLAATLPAP